MVTHALVTQFDRFLELLPEHEQSTLKSLPLVSALAMIRSNHSRHEGLAAQISEYGHRSLAASFSVRATKPANYDTARGDKTSTPHDRAAYYAARMGVIQRHHEIELYRRFASEKHKHKSMPSLTPMPPLNDVLAAGKVTTPHVEGAYQTATKLLKKWDANLTSIRDEAIRLFLA
jgi:hypothetical protein